MCVEVYMYVGRGSALGVLFLGSHSLGFFEIVSSLDLKLTDGLGWLAKEPQDPLSLLPQL